MIETGVSPTVSTLSVSRARPKGTLKNFKDLLLHPRSLRKQDAPSADPEPSRAQPEVTQQLENTTLQSNVYRPGGPDGNCKLDPSSSVQLLRPDSAGKNVGECANEDAGSQEEFNQSAPTPPKARLSPSSTNSIREEEREVPQPQRTKMRLRRSFSTFPYKRNGERRMTTSSSTQLVVAGSERKERTKIQRAKTGLGLSGIASKRSEAQGAPMTTFSSTHLAMARPISKSAHSKTIQHKRKAQSEKPPVSESRSNPVVVDKEDEEQIVLQGVHDGLGIQRAKILLGSVSTTALPLTHGASTSSSICKGPPHLRTAQPEEKDAPVTVPLHVEGRKTKSEDAKDPEQTPRESEEIATLRSQVAELQKRCEAQSRDLESSNSFLNATDKSSDSDVINALQRLNAEVQQSTTYMADCLVDDFEYHNVTTNPTNEQISSVQMASETIGSVLARSLGTKPPKDIPMLLQIAFQAYLASALGQTVSSWVFEPAHNKFISAIYQSLRAVEAQAVSGRWRSLARVHIVHSWVGHPDDLIRGIISGFSDILLAAGCSATRSELVTKMTSNFTQKIALLVELAVRLNKLFDEIISSDFEILVVQPGERFESKDMENTDGDQVGVRDASVLCATHLGLIKRMPAGTLWERGKKQKMMVLKPKVLLESFLDAED